MANVNIFMNEFLLDVFDFILQLFHHLDSSVAITLLAAWTGISPLFIYCYFGKLATESYEQMSDCLYYDFDWPYLPVKSQKCLIVMIANMQRPIYYHGFKIAILDLRTFIQVNNSIRLEIKMIQAHLFDQICTPFSLFVICFSSLQLIRKVFSFYMMFKAITAP